MPCAGGKTLPVFGLSRPLCADGDGAPSKLMPYMSEGFPTLPIGASEGREGVGTVSGAMPAAGTFRVALLSGFAARGGESNGELGLSLDPRCNKLTAWPPGPSS